MNWKTISVWLIGVVVCLTVVLLIVWQTVQGPALVRAQKPIIPRSVPQQVIHNLPVILPQSTPHVRQNVTSTAASLLFVGDLMLDRSVATRTKASGEEDYPFRKLPLGWLAAPDLTIANLEGSLTDKRRPPEKTIDFQFDPAWTNVLKQQGFDVFSQANNHALDQGQVGYEDAVKRLRAAGFLVFGHQVQDGLIALATTTVNGRTIAFVGWNTTDNPIDLTQATLALEAAHQAASTTIAFMHWGIEYQNHPTQDNIILSHWLIDHGVDVVIGGHPHWVQGISEYHGHPIAWSLGNFVFDQDFSKETQQGLALKLVLRTGGMTIQPIPLRIVLSQPALEEGASLQTRLDGLAAISDESLRPTIRAGQALEFSF